MKYYYNILEEADGFTVTFPDVPEAITCGATREEAVKYLFDCLATALDFYDVLPESKTITNNFIEVERDK